MKKASLKTVLSLLIFAVFTTNPEISICQNLLNGPRKIVIDAKRDLLYVSNGNTGDVVQIDSVGKQKMLFAGAGFIDGMEIIGDILYGVSANRTVKAYDLVTKQLVLSATVPGFPTDPLTTIVYDSAGHLFISCPSLNTIYRMPLDGDTSWVFAKDHGLNNPNGMFLEKDKDRLIVMNATAPLSKILSVNLSDSTITNLANIDFKQPTGIVRDTANIYFICGYYMNGIYKITIEKTQTVNVFQKIPSTVYLTYDNRDHSLLYVNTESNRWGKILLRK
jgi:hypothetical protein